VKHGSESPVEPRRTNLKPGDNAPFTPEPMARFREVLADTGLVAQACRAVGKHRDTAYAHRRSNPLFAAALPMLDSDTSDNPPFDKNPVGNVSDSNFGSDRVWREDEGVWWTSFPPPGDFVGKERGHCKDEDYGRECTLDECDLLNASGDFGLADVRAAEEAGRKTFFSELRQELADLQHADSAVDQDSDEMLTETRGDPLLGVDHPAPDVDPDRG
jgi:hypothetical protein